MRTGALPSSAAACLLAVVLVLPPSLASATTLAPAAPAAPAKPKPKAEPKTSSGWLRYGEARERDNDFEAAGEAYRKALDALSPKKQRANEGARAAILSAEAYVRAFETDGDVAHLEAGFDVLDHWLQQAGPSNRATLRTNVERMMAQLRAIRDPLLESKASLEAGKVDEAAEHSKAAIEAITHQQRDWSAGARIAIQTADAQVAAYEETVDEVEDIEPNLRKLQSAKKTLEQLQSDRPPDDQSKEGALVQQRLVEIETRIVEEQRRLQDEQLAQQEREAAAAAEAERRRQQELEQARQAEEAAATSETAAGGKRTQGIILLATGAVATAAGAGVLGEGLAFAPGARRSGDAEQAQADALEQMYGDAYSREDFDRALQDYRDDLRRRTVGMSVGGSVLLAGGLAAGIVGAVMLAKHRRGKGSSPAREKVAVTPSVSRSQVRLSLTARF